MQIRKVAAATARHQDLFADLVGAFEHDDAAATIAGRNGAQEPGGTATDHYYVNTRHAGRIAGSPFLDFSRANAF